MVSNGHDIPWALRSVAYDLVRLWETLGDPMRSSEAEKLRKPAWVLVWREGEQPVFGLLPAAEGLALANMQQGSTFGDVCAALLNNGDAAAAPDTAGTMLRNWLELGLVQRIFSLRHSTSKCHA